MKMRKAAIAGVLAVLAAVVIVSAALDGKTISAVNEIMLADGATTAKGSGVLIEGDNVTINTAGTYRVTGSLSDGCINVNSAGEVKLILDGVSVANSQGAAFNAQTGYVTLKLAEGNGNVFSDGGDYDETDENEETDAAVYCEEGLVITGDGALEVNGNRAGAVTSKDNLTVESGNIKVNAVGGGIKGKTALTVNGGILDITASGSALYSSKGNAVINDGKININSQGKGIKGETEVVINGGELAVVSEDDAVHSDGTVEINGGSFEITTDDDGVHAETALTVNDCEMEILSCYEGLEGQTVVMNGGNVKLKASDDGVNAAGENSQPDFGGGGFKGEKPEGERPDGEMKRPPDGEMRQPAEGERPDGEMRERPDFGDRAENGEFDGEMQGRNRGERPVGGGMMDYDEDCLVEINGGRLIVDAEGDGLDSNGDIKINGGTVVVFGPENSGNGALDCGGSIAYNGGVVLAVGASGMAESPGGDVSDAYSFIYNGEAVDEGNRLSIVNKETGEVIVSAVMPKRISSIVFGDESLGENTVLEIYEGGNLEEASDFGDYSTGGSLTDGTLIQEITLTEKVTQIGSGGFGGGFGGGHMGGGPMDEPKNISPTEKQ